MRRRDCKKKEGYGTVLSSCVIIDRSAARAGLAIGHFIIPRSDIHPPSLKKGSGSHAIAAHDGRDDELNKR